MKRKCFCKIFALSVIFLFVGVSFSSAISVDTHSIIENEDRQMIILLMIELQDKIFEKTIEYEPFIDFLKDIAKKQNYEYFENLGMYVGDATIIPCKCIEKLYHDYHESNNDYLLKKIKKMEIFFKKCSFGLG